jgi:UDP-glucose 4-epimerase
MNVLVTGGAGYIGSHFVLELQDAGHDAVVLDNLSTGDIRALPPYVPFVRGDVEDRETLQAIFERHSIDAVVHFAGSSADPETEPLNCYRDTVGSQVLIEACRSAGVRDLVFSSTAAVYSPSVRPVDETAPTRPGSTFGRSKLAVEWMLEDAARAHGLRAAALRYFSVAGADPYMRTGKRSPTAPHLIKALAEASIGLRDHVKVFGRDYDTPDGTCVRDYVHVSDLASAHLRALEWLRRGAAGEYGVFNCGCGEGKSVLDVIASARRVAGSKFAVRDAERRTADLDFVVAIPTRVISVLGWRPKYTDLEQVISHSIEWERRLLEARTR